MNWERTVKERRKCRAFPRNIAPFSLVFPFLRNVKWFHINKGGRAMQCQKLKTYMETGRVVFLPARSIRPNPA